MVTIGDKVIRRKSHLCNQDFLENERKKIDYKWMTQIGPNEVSIPTVLREITKEYVDAGLGKPTYRRVWKIIDKARKRALPSDARPVDSANQ